MATIRIQPWTQAAPQGGTRKVLTSRPINGAARGHWITANQNLTRPVAPQRPINPSAQLRPVSADQVGGREAKAWARAGVQAGNTLDTFARVKNREAALERQGYKAEVELQLQHAQSQAEQLNAEQAGQPENWENNLRAAFNGVMNKHRGNMQADEVLRYEVGEMADRFTQRAILRANERATKARVERSIGRIQNNYEEHMRQGRFGDAQASLQGLQGIIPADEYERMQQGVGIAQQMHQANQFIEQDPRAAWQILREKDEEGNFTAYKALSLQEREALQGRAMQRLNRRAQEELATYQQTRKSTMDEIELNILEHGVYPSKEELTHLAQTGKITVDFAKKIQRESEGKQRSKSTTSNKADHSPAEFTRPLRAILDYNAGDDLERLQYQEIQASYAHLPTKERRFLEKIQEALGDPEGAEEGNLLGDALRNLSAHFDQVAGGRSAEEWAQLEAQENHAAMTMANAILADPNFSEEDAEKLHRKLVEPLSYGDNLGLLMHQKEDLAEPITSDYESRINSPMGSHDSAEVEKAEMELELALMARERNPSDPMAMKRHIEAQGKLRLAKKARDEYQAEYQEQSADIEAATPFALEPATIGRFREFGGQLARPAGGWYSGVKVTLFGGDDDPADNGLSALGGKTGYHGGVSHQQGAAAPARLLVAAFPNLEQHFNASLANGEGGFDEAGKKWIKENARVLIQTSTGQTLLVPVVDLGAQQNEWRKAGSPTLDLTEGILNQLGGRAIRNAQGHKTGVANAPNLRFTLITQGQQLDPAQLAEMSWAEAQRAHLPQTRMSREQLDTERAQLRSQYEAATLGYRPSYMNP